MPLTGKTPMPLDGGSARQLTYLNSMNYGPAWSSDDREIAFISMEGEKARVWKVDFLIKGNLDGWLFNPKYSADGKKIAVFWNRAPSRGIWFISLENEERKFIFQGVHLPVGWSRDGRWIYAANAARNTLEIIAVDAEKGGSKILLTVPLDPEKGVPNHNFVTMTPDGRKFIFVVEKSLSDIWLVENFDPDIK